MDGARTYVRRRLHVTAVVLLALTAVILMAARSTADEQTQTGAPLPLRQVSLRPLPPGEPRLQTFDALIQVVPAASILPRTTVLFTGLVVDKGGSEAVSSLSSEAGPAVTVHRIRFRVDAVFRGPRVDTIDVTALDAEDLDPFEMGNRYVVFAEPRTFGSESKPRLASVGYWQGSFLIGKDPRNPQIAVNRRGDEVDATHPLRGPTATVSP